MNPLKAGDIAPKFSLPDQDGEQVNLTDFQGQREWKREQQGQYGKRK